MRPLAGKTIRLSMAQADQLAEALAMTRRALSGATIVEAVLTIKKSLAAQCDRELCDMAGPDWTPDGRKPVITGVCNRARPRKCRGRRAPRTADPLVAEHEVSGSMK